MEKHFVTYDQAVALKYLGYDPFMREDCLAYFNTSNSNHDLETKDWWCLPKNDFQYALSAPLKQQAFIFLLNKCDDLHGAELSIEYFGDESGVLKNYGGNFTSLTQAIDKLIMLANDKMP